MPRFLLLAAAFAHLVPGKDTSSRSDSDPDAEKEGSVDLGGAPKAGNRDVGDNDDENLYASDEEQDGPGLTEGEGEEPRPNQPRGIRLFTTSTVSSSTTLSGVVRPTLPRWLVKIKEVLFGSPSHPDEAEVYAPHYRLTPILAGSLIPFSILLQIPGLTEHWYVRTSGNTIIEARSNSALLEASLVLSMALAVFANLALICRFLERRVKRCTILCIVALTLHGKPSILCHYRMHMTSLDILNIATVITFGLTHRFDDGFTYGEAYWMTICSTVVSMITNITLIWDLVKTPNFSKSGSWLITHFEFHSHVLSQTKVAALLAGNVRLSSSR
jgi:potassium channel subfamily K